MKSGNSESTFMKRTRERCSQKEEKKNIRRFRIFNFIFQKYSDIFPQSLIFLIFTTDDSSADIFTTDVIDEDRVADESQLLKGSNHRLK